MVPSPDGAGAKWRLIQTIFLSDLRSAGPYIFCKHCAGIVPLPFGLTAIYNTLRQWPVPGPSARLKTNICSNAEQVRSDADIIADMYNSNLVDRLPITLIVRGVKFNIKINDM